MPGGHDEDPIFGTRQPGEQLQGQTTNLADLILEKIAEHEAKLNGETAGGNYIHGGGAAEDAVQIPAKAVEVYEKYVKNSVLRGSDLAPFTNALPESA